jgi:hypothetical protein
VISLPDPSFNAGRSRQCGRDDTDQLALQDIIDFTRTNALPSGHEKCISVAEFATRPRNCILGAADNGIG